METGFGFSGVLLWKVREPRVNCGFIVGKMVATGFRVRPRGEGSKEEVRWKWGEGVGKQVTAVQGEDPNRAQRLRTVGAPGIVLALGSEGRWCYLDAQLPVVEVVPSGHRGTRPVHVDLRGAGITLRADLDGPSDHEAHLELLE